MGSCPKALGREEHLSSLQVGGEATDCPNEQKGEGCLLVERTSCLGDQDCPGMADP